MGHESAEVAGIPRIQGVIPAAGEPKNGLKISMGIFDALNSQIAIIDRCGMILHVNRAWINFGLENGADPGRIGAGVNYLDVLDRVTGEYRPLAEQFARAIRAILDGREHDFIQEYACPSPEEGRWFVGRVTRLVQDDLVGAVISHQNISVRKQAELEMTQALMAAEAMSNVAKSMAARLDTEEILRTIIKEVSHIINFESSNLMIVENGVARIRYWDGYDQEISRHFDHLRFPIDQFPNLKKMVETAEPIICSDISKCPFWYTVPDADWVRSYIGVPIVARGRVLGFLNLDSQIPGYYREKDMKQLTSFGHLVAVAMENAQLYQNLDRYAADLEDLINERTSELRLMNERLETVLENTSHGIVLLNDRFEIRQANLAFEKMFALSKGEAIGQNLLDHFEGPNRRVLRQALCHVQDTHRPARLELRSPRPGGEEFEAEVNLVFVEKTDGSIVATWHDIRHLREIDRLKDKFIDTMSHEFRTPITSILLLADALRKYEDRMSQGQRLEKIDQLVEQATLLKDMSEAILEFSRIQSGTINSNLLQVDFGHIAVDVLEAIRPKIQNHRQSVQIYHDSRQEVYVTQGQVDLARIWRNLIDNAVKYSPHGSGEITIRIGVATLSPSGELHLSDTLDEAKLPPDLLTLKGRFAVGQITDNGHGIGEKDQAQLFNRFYRGWAEQSDIPGTGLGLAMVKEMLTAAQGGVDVMSSLGHGATFTFWVPLAAEVNS